MAEKPDDKAGKNRRKFERATVLWSGNLVCGDEVIDCLIINVSPAGAMVRVENPDLCKENSAVLRCPRFGVLSGEITRRQDKELGIEFLDSEQVVAKKMEKALS